MRRNLNVLLVMACLCLLLASVAHAWEVEYQGTVLPTSPTLGAYAWQSDGTTYLSDTTIENGLLRMVDRRQDRTVRFYREGSFLPMGTNVTIEARVKVQSAESPYGFWQYAVGFGAYVVNGTGAFVGLWPDRIATRYGAENNLRFHYLDMTQFHVIRMAIDADRDSFCVWADNALVFSGTANNGVAGGVHFGTTLDARDSADVHWDYLAYSKEFLPVPEPSSLLALTGGMMYLVPYLKRRKA